jgi:hypothetical protein
MPHLSIRDISDIIKGFPQLPPPYKRGVEIPTPPVVSEKAVSL